VDDMSWPTSCNGKAVCWIVPFNMLNLHYNQWEASWILEAIVNSPLGVPPPRYGQIYKILFGQSPNKKQYEVIIWNFPTCTCLDFGAIMSSSLGWWAKWVPCKHMYYVL
jgi:hypothetical protein